MITPYKDIKRVHIEMTTKCNASCPQCARNIEGGAVIPGLPMVELPLTYFKKVFKDEFIAHVDRWFLCGLYGDPAIAKDTKEVCRWLIKKNPNVEIDVSTNGSLRKPEWWEDFAHILGKNGIVEWGLDGLADTSHIYRVGTNWDVIMRNAQAFNNAGGRSRWQFITFSHNEHQIDEALQMATDLGFEEFKIKRSKKSYNIMAPGTPRLAPVRNRKNPGTYSHIVEPPKLDKNKNPALIHGQEIFDAFGGVDEYIKNTPIKCSAIRHKEVFITSEGYVLPCDYLAGIYNKGNSFNKFLENWGPNALDLLNPKNSSLKHVIEGEIFREIANSWKGKNRIRTCSLICGVTNNMSIKNDHIRLK